MWQTIRLELARTETFPRGSPARSYLLQLPLDEAGEIDAAEVASNPERATFRRFWPSEADEIGLVTPNGSGWVFRCDRAADGSAVYRLGSPSFRVSEMLEIKDPRGKSLPFRVASMRRLAHDDQE